MVNRMIYFVPTPIGNLEDISLRSLRVLQESDIIACEDTRTTKKLLDHYDIKAQLISYHKFNEFSRIEEIISLSNEEKQISVVSDAGMPGISDPGNILINALIENNIKYTVLPGASAFTTALVLSGFDNTQFTFLGFIPSKSGERNRFIDSIKNRNETLIFYETPHRLVKTLEQFAKVIPNRRIAVVREISKIYEEILIFEASDYENVDIKEKGEFVILVDKNEEIIEITDEYILEKLKEEIQNGKTKKTAVKEISKELDISKNRVYNLSIEI
ncbi:16S rRNA (cytidine(1402)-2'-O)-methyltransferase [Helcococcus kunzii]|nr:16S rRNA (cytidine(1402)-2'-O)-methyltransferase [Helcococcus kunzii]MCT1796556.1 16S rRNA (cytidine(1402)-2'-O)-methyltransferase [Helcococcus kunzii]MCT1989619.1 16S rRNA (cytidine(1402)-2'-O)-methyltransferase [Helcococcus kunzii]